MTPPWMKSSLALSIEPNESFKAFSISPGILLPRRLHPFPEMGVIIMLAGIVEHGGVLAERALDDLLKRLALPFGPFQRIIAVVDVGEMMLVVMEFESFRRHVGFQRVVRIGQIGQREGHEMAPWEVGGEIGNPVMAAPWATFSPRTPAPQLHDNPSLRGLSYLLTDVYELMFRGGNRVASFE